MIAQLAAGIAGPLFKLVDNLFTSDEERDKAKFQILKMQQEGKLKEVEQEMSIMLAEANSNDKWTSRSRPSFNYVMYFLIVCSVPMGVLSAFHPDMAEQIATGMKMWLAAIPPELWNAFWICFTGYAAGRSYEKVKGVTK